MNNKQKKNHRNISLSIRFIIFIVLFLLISELSLRFFLGFCDAPLNLESNRYEYIFAPNQQRVRFGNKISYNEYSQRGSTIDPKKEHILCLGDSVLNGGVLTDDDDLATSIISNTSPYQALNISVGSWSRIIAQLISKRKERLMQN